MATQLLLRGASLCIALFACPTPTYPFTADAGADNPRPSARRKVIKDIAVPAFEYEKGKLPRLTGQMETRQVATYVSNYGSAVRHLPTSVEMIRPRGRQAPWRPLRYFGPFRTGSDPTRIQIHLNGHDATWHYNDF